MRGTPWERCPLCGTPLEGISGCSACPMAGGCGKLRCPRCGYALPDLSRSRLARWTARLLGQPWPTCPERESGGSS